jgi:hypothetical protein
VLEVGGVRTDPVHEGERDRLEREPKLGWFITEHLDVATGEISTRKMRTLSNEAKLIVRHRNLQGVAVPAVPPSGIKGTVTGALSVKAR